MAKKINIWGRPNCELPNGERCDACCILPEFTLRRSLGMVTNKLEHSPCPHLNDSGCSLHGGDKPSNCKNYHCSSSEELVTLYEDDQP